MVDCSAFAYAVEEMRDMNVHSVFHLKLLMCLSVTAITFMVVVEDTVVGTGIGMRIPKSGCTEAEGRGLLLHLSQSLL